MHDLLHTAASQPYLAGHLCMQGGGGGVQKFRASKGAPLHGGKLKSRFRRFKRRRAQCMQTSLAPHLVIAWTL